MPPRHRLDRSCPYPSRLVYISAFFCRLQIANMEYACGNAGNGSTFRLAVDLASLDCGGCSIGGTLNVLWNGIPYMRATIPTGSSVNPAALVALTGAQVSPSATIDRNYVTVNIDIPCTAVTAGQLSTLNFTVSGADDFQLRQVTVSACRLETCGGHGITCPGLNATKPCTPGAPFHLWNHLCLLFSGDSVVTITNSFRHQGTTATS
jgi:hypothetical protein